MAYSTRRYSYDDDSASAQGLWVVVLVVAAMVGSFLFGRYVLGERLKPSASPVRNAPSAAVSGAETVRPADAQPGEAPAPVSIVTADDPTAQPAAAQPDAQATLNAAIERARSGELSAEPATTAPEETNPTAEAERAAAEQRRRDEEQKKKQQQAEEQRRRQEQEAERKKREEAARAQADKPKPKPETQPAAEKPKPQPAARPARAPAPPLGPGEKPQPSAAPDPTQAAPSGGQPQTDVNYRVRVGTFSTADQAAQRQSELKAKGQEAYVRVRSEGGRTVYDVQAGAYSSEENARAKADELRSQGFSAETTSSR